MQNVEDAAPRDAVGQHVAVQRKLAGLTQYQLADRAHVSKSLVSQVERGTVPASPAFTAAVARALRVDVDTLYGQPPPIDPTAEHAGIPMLRRALDRAHNPEICGQPLTAAELRARLDKCEQDRQRSRYAQVLSALPDLLNHAYVLINNARTAVEGDQAWVLLTDAYLLAQATSYRFGYIDLAALCNKCCSEAAHRSNDLLRVATAAYLRGILCLHYGDYVGVLKLMEATQSEIAGERDPAADAVRTVLHLRQAIAQARMNALDRADEHIDEARRLAAIDGVPSRPLYNINASPINVEIHWVAVPVELSDGTSAVGRAAQVHIPERTEPHREGHHWVDVARAWTLHGDRVKALESLNSARRVAPQLTRYHPQVHETVRILAETDRRATDSLAGFGPLDRCHPLSAIARSTECYLSSGIK